MKRPADAVLGAARKWIESVSGNRFFAFIHLYDAHQPYSHGSYDAEIAYIDQSIGRFRRSLAAGSAPKYPHHPHFRSRRKSRANTAKRLMATSSTKVP